MKNYLNISFTGVLPMEYAVDDPIIHKDAVNDGYKSGRTYEDFLSGAWIMLSPEQEAFYALNPTASPKEIIEMRIAPPPKEPSLEELKQDAINVVNRQAVGRIDALFPLSIIRDIIFGRLNEEEVAQLHIEYNNAITWLGIALTAARERIEEAQVVEDTRDAISQFDDTTLAISVADEYRNTIADRLVDVARDARTVGDENEKRTFN